MTGIKGIVGALILLGIMAGVLFYINQGATAFAAGPAGNTGIPLQGWALAALMGAVVFLGYWNAIQKMRMKKNTLR
ncbi:MAG: hypothetical protein HY393_03110 [Candidatus Diapherotrites archaeon]|nr:hypothetical protein [Candidatus Diapherotrites archaeon]